MLVVRGKLNNQIADELGTAERTVKWHRHNVMQKLQIQSLSSDEFRIAGQTIEASDPSTFVPGAGRSTIDAFVRNNDLGRSIVRFEAHGYALGSL